MILESLAANGEWPQLELLSGRNADSKVEWPLTQRISAPGVRVQISVLEETFHATQYAVTAELQQEPSAIIDVSITMLHWRSQPSISHHIVRNVCIEVPVPIHLPRCVAAATWYL